MRRIQHITYCSGRRREVGVPGLHGDDETAEIGNAGWPSTAGDVLDPTGHILGTGLGRWCRPRPRFWTWGPVGLPRHVSMRALAVDVFDVDGRADQMGRPRYIDERFPTLRALEHGQKGCGGRRKPSSDPLGRPARDAAQSSGGTSRGECVRNRVPVLAAAGIVAQLCICVELRAGEDENFVHRRCKRAARSPIVCVAFSRNRSGCFFYFIARRDHILSMRSGALQDGSKGALRTLPGWGGLIRS